MNTLRTVLGWVLLIPVLAVILLVGYGVPMVRAMWEAMVSPVRRVLSVVKEQVVAWLRWVFSAL